MASLFQLFFIFLTISFSQAQTSPRPKALVVPVTKDPKTLQYITTFIQRQPPVPVNLMVDLGGQFVWIDCASDYTSSTYRPALCKSAQCSAANANFCSSCPYSTPTPVCNKNTCEVIAQNSVSEFITNGYVSMDVLSLRSTDGYKVGNVVSVPQFIFACTQSYLTNSLASGTNGIAALGRTKIALPSQLSAAFSFPRKFAICLSTSDNSPGAIFFGDKPYKYFDNGDASELFAYTKLLSNPVSTNGVALKGEGSFEYFMGVTGITIAGKALPLNASLLSIARNGKGGTKFSTVEPYSILETSIYKVFTESFVREAAAMNITRVASVAPFGACFNSQSIRNIRGRLQIPSIDLVLQTKNVWPVYPTNTLVRVSNDVMCLAFIDESTVNHVQPVPRASILLGGYQLENNLIQFDLATLRIGFVNMLYGFTTTCSSFKSSV